MKMKFYVFFIVLVTGCGMQPQNHMLAQEKNCAFYRDTLLNKIIFTEVDSFPQFSERESDFQRFLAYNFKTPDDAGSYKATPEVIVSDSGDVIGVFIKGKTAGQYTSLDNEFIRLLKSKRVWKPAYCNGKKVYCRYEMYEWGISWPNKKKD